MRNVGAQIAGCVINYSQSTKVLVWRQPIRS